MGPTFTTSLTDRHQPPKKTKTTEMRATGNLFKTDPRLFYWFLMHLMRLLIGQLSFCYFAVFCLVYFSNLCLHGAENQVKRAIKIDV
jgi:hypothetical protein